MPLQNFVAKALPTVKAVWLNQVDVLKFTVFADAATKAAARTALELDPAIGFSGTDSGAVNAAVVTLLGPVTGYIRAIGSMVTFLATTANTGAMTINVNGTGIVAVINQQGNACTGGEFSVPATVQWTGANWKIVGGSIPPSQARTPAETTNSVVPVNYMFVPGHARRYNALGDGATNDTTALRNWAASAGSGTNLQLAPGGVYIFDPSIVTNGVLFSAKAGFSIFGNGATIKCINGASVVAQHEMMRFNNCQDFYVENLIIDANRANRTPVEATAHNLNVEDNCARGEFHKVRCINGVTDGIYVGTDTGGTASTYPTDILFADCSAENCYRNNFSIVASLRCTIRGGRFFNANGLSPQGGIDAEPDPSITSANIDLVIENVDCSGNGGYGVNISRSGGTIVNTRVTLRNIRGNSNTGGLIAVSCVNGLDIDGVFCGPHSACTRGLVDIQNGSVENVTLRNLNFNGITINSTSRWLLYLFAATGRVLIDGFRSYNSPNIPCILASATATIQDVELAGVPDLAINNSAANTVVRNLVCQVATGRVVYNTGTNFLIENAVFTDCLVASSNAMTMDTGGTFSIVRNVTVRQTSSIPASAVGVFWNEIPGTVQNFYCKSAGTDFTAANSANFAQGTVGAFISGCWAGGQDFSSGGIITPATITANTNDYAPTDLKSAGVLRIASDAARNVTGLTGGSNNRILKVFNIGGFDIVFTDNDALSAAANRFLCGGAMTLNANEGLTLWYDGPSARWRSFGRAI